MFRQLLYLCRERHPKSKIVREMSGVVYLGCDTGYGLRIIASENTDLRHNLHKRRYISYKPKKIDPVLRANSTLVKSLHAGVRMFERYL
jgi:hypothetical protein